MNFKNYYLICALIIALICASGVVSAVSDVNDTVSEIDTTSDVSIINQDDLISTDNANTTLNVQESEDTSAAASDNVTAQEATSQGSDNVAVASTDSSKSNLKITNTTNFVKSGDTLYLYLTDLKGNAVPNKKVTIDFNGNTYSKTTDANGKFGIKVTSSKKSDSMTINFKGDDKYNAFSKTFKFYIENSISIQIGNSKLLTNGYLRVYLKGPTSSISGKTVKITIGKKVFTKKVSPEGFVVIKPMVGAKTYDIVVQFGNYVISKKVKCVKGDVKNPLKTKVPTVNGVPDIDSMPSKFVMGDNDAQYTLKKSQYREVIKRDSYSLYLYGKLSKYVFFKTKASPKVYHILKREKWNVIERAINTKIVKMNTKKNYWPKTITVSLKGKSYTYPVVRDIQNTGYTCGPTSASVCSQALKKYNSEKFFQIKAHVTSGVNIPDLKRALDTTKFKTSYFYTGSFNSAIKQLAKGGAALIAFLPNHYVSIVDVSHDGKKILVSNSYGDYNVGGDSKVPTTWVSVKYFKSKFAGVGLVVKLNYKLSKKDKKLVKNAYSSMGKKWTGQNTNERIPNIGL